MDRPNASSSGHQRIGPTIADSTPSFQTDPRAPGGAPNVVVVVLDDLGFGQLGCFGSDLATPTIDGLAERGLRFNRFHVTAMCSPTRACLLTGRNQHRVGMGFVSDVPIGFPGYNGRIPRTAAGMPRLLRDAGYATFAVGKWHLAPRWVQSAAGPFDLWPLGQGFQRYYGFLAGDANQWTPELVSDNGFVEPPGRPEDGYHLTEDLVDRAQRMILDQRHARPDQPFFLYFATGAMHAPHQAPRDWIDRERGRFDGGWDRWRDAVFERQTEMGIVPNGTTLPPRPPWVSEWDSLSADQQRLYARQMECFAGFLAHTDDQLGRLMRFLTALDVLDNTIVVVISDNGTSAEGGPMGSHNEHRFTHDMLDDPADSLARIDELGGFRAYNHYAWGWAWAGNTPMRLWKRYSWLGGVRTPMVVHWPERIATNSAGAVRSQFCHAVDVLPTVLEAIGIEPPEMVDGIGQLSLDGRSLLSVVDDPDAPDPRSTQYFEIIGSRAIFHDGWKATTDHIGQQLSIERDLVPGSHDFEHDHWALFDLRTDFAEAHDVSADHPEVVADLEDRWWAEAHANQVLPLDDSLIGRAVAMEPNPNGVLHTARYLPGGGPIAEDFLPPMGAGFRLTAELGSTSVTTSGIVCALGDWNNGWAVYLLDGVPVVTFNLFGRVHRTVGSEKIVAGSHTLVIEYRPRAGADAGVSISVDGGADIGRGSLGENLPFRWQIGGTGLRIGADVGFPVCDDYATPFAFEGTVTSVTIDIPSLNPLRDTETDAGAGPDSRSDTADHIARVLHHE